jgi:outer membrane protein assembly factor BamB
VPEPAAFRHDPVRSVLPRAGPWRPDWETEPAVVGHRRLTYRNERLGRTIQVPVSSTPAVVPGFGCVVASDDGFVRLYSQRLENVVWERRVPASVYASVVVDPSRQHLLVTTTTGLVSCFTFTGAPVWQTRLGSPVCATPTLAPDGSAVVVACFEHLVRGLNLEDGRPVFETQVPAPWHRDVGGVASSRDPYATPAAVGDGVVVAAGESALLVRPDGEVVWETPLGASVRASPVSIAATGEVLVVTTAGRALFLDAADGSRRGRVDLGAKVTASPALSGGTVVVGLVTGESVGLSVEHEVRWRTALGAPRDHTSWSVLPNGAFMATVDRGNVLCLRPEDGGFVWETSQVLGEPDHDPRMDISPVAGPDGALYCASYAGSLYEFAFPRTEDQL